MKILNQTKSLLEQIFLISIGFCICFILVLSLDSMAKEITMAKENVTAKEKACTDKDNKKATEIKSELDAIQKQWTPDLRLNVFEWQVKQSGLNHNCLLLRTTSREAKQAVQDLLNKKYSDWKSKLILLPDENINLQGKFYGIVALSSIMIRKKPEFAAELGTQGIMGMPVRILDQMTDSGWILICNQDGYLGYVTSESIKSMDRNEFNNWVDCNKLIYRDWFGLVYSQPELNCSTLSDLIAGCVLQDEGKEVGQFRQISLPSGTKGWVLKDRIQSFEEWRNTGKFTPDNLVKTAKTMLGFPYVWGGTTIKGIDCSGLVSVAMFLNRTTILRDVSQLQRLGTSLDLSKGYKSWLPGDLVIFGKRKTDGTLSYRHVAIYLGDSEFIHSATRVRINSFDSSRTNHDQHNSLKEVVKVIRLTEEPESRFFCPVKNNQFYQKVK